MIPNIISMPLGHILAPICSFIGIAAAIGAIYYMSTHLCKTILGFILGLDLFFSSNDVQPNHRGKKMRNSPFAKFMRKFKQKFKQKMAGAVTYCSLVIDSTARRAATLGALCVVIVVAIDSLSTTQPTISPSLESKNLLLSFLQDYSTISAREAKIFANFCAILALLIETRTGITRRSPLRLAALIPGVAIGIYLLKFLLLYFLHSMGEDLVCFSCSFLIGLVIFAMVPIFVTPEDPRLHFNFCCGGIIIMGASYWLAKWTRNWNPSLCEFVIVFTPLTYYLYGLLLSLSTVVSNGEESGEDDEDDDSSNAGGDNGNDDNMDENVDDQGHLTEMNWICYLNKHYVGM